MSQLKLLKDIFRLCPRANFIGLDFCWLKNFFPPFCLSSLSGWSAELLCWVSAWGSDGLGFKPTEILFLSECLYSFPHRHKTRRVFPHPDSVIPSDMKREGTKRKNRTVNCICLISLFWTTSLFIYRGSPQRSGKPMGYFWKEHIGSRLHLV